MTGGFSPWGEVTMNAWFDPHMSVFPQRIGLETSIESSLDLGALVPTNAVDMVLSWIKWVYHPQSTNIEPEGHQCLEHWIVFQPGFGSVYENY